mmetsp:Transcript_73037/g.213991  ORF Transcript_73037/g.213991 Transcript_73037/m.213991 type:complete len:204 (+) Transcript_73037:188-799(+)
MWFRSRTCSRSMSSPCMRISWRRACLRRWTVRTCAFTSSHMCGSVGPTLTLMVSSCGTSRAYATRSCMEIRGTYLRHMIGRRFQQAAAPQRHSRRCAPNLNNRRCWILSPSSRTSSMDTVGGTTSRCPSERTRTAKQQRIKRWPYPRSPTTLSARRTSGWSRRMPCTRRSSRWWGMRSGSRVDGAASRSGATSSRSGWRRPSS